jgi:hypothetical protein
LPLTGSSSCSDCTTLWLEALRSFETYRKTRRHVLLESSAALQSSHGINCYRRFGTSVHIYRQKTAIFTQLLATQNVTPKLGRAGSVPLSAPNSEGLALCPCHPKTRKGWLCACPCQLQTRKDWLCAPVSSKLGRAGSVPLSAPNSDGLALCPCHPQTRKGWLCAPVSSKLGRTGSVPLSAPNSEGLPLCPCQLQTHDRHMLRHGVERNASRLTRACSRWTHQQLWCRSQPSTYPVTCTFFLLMGTDGSFSGGKAAGA